MTLTPAGVLAARRAPEVPGQLDLFAVDPAPSVPAECERPETCTDYDPCQTCLSEALGAGLAPAADAAPSNTAPERTDR
jgi:hypothetical protein